MNVTTQLIRSLEIYIVLVYMYIHYMGNECIIKVVRFEPSSKNWML